MIGCVNNRWTRASSRSNLRRHQQTGYSIYSLGIVATSFANPKHRLLRSLFFIFEGALLGSTLAYPPPVSRYRRLAYRFLFIRFGIAVTGSVNPAEPARTIQNPCFFRVPSVAKTAVRRLCVKFSCPDAG